MADADDSAARVLVVVAPNGARSLNEYVRLGVDVEQALDPEAANFMVAHDNPVEVAHARSEAELNALIAEAVINDEWVAVARFRSGGVRAVGIGPLHLDASPELKAAVERSRKAGDGC